MVKRDDYRQMLMPYLTDGRRFAQLESVLMAASGLPGPRSNLELAWALGDAVAEHGVGADQWAALLHWAALSEQEGPTNDPHEYLPFCALQALAALYIQQDAQRQVQIVAILKRAASDRRWRMREAAAMAFQRIAEADFAVVQTILAEWLPSATLVEQRAILAALAHPRVLDRTERVSFCLHVADRVLSGVLTLDRAARRTPEFEILDKGLQYALSVFVAYAPEEGFAFLKRWAAVADDGIRRIVRTNLTKARLAKRFPAQVAEVLAVLDTAAGSGAGPSVG